MEPDVPFEVGYEKAKAEIIAAIGQIGSKYSIPTSLLNLIVAQICLEAKLNTYETILSAYDIEVPEELKQLANKPAPTPPANKQPESKQPPKPSDK